MKLKALLLGSKDGPNEFYPEPVDSNSSHFFPRLQIHTYFTSHSMAQGSTLLIILDFIILEHWVRSPITRLLFAYFAPPPRYFLFLGFKY